MADDKPKPDDLETKDLDKVSGGAFDTYAGTGAGGGKLTEAGSGGGGGKLTDGAGGPRPK